MQSLSPQLQEKAQIYAQMHDPAMPVGRWNLADQVGPVPVHTSTIVIF